MATTSLWVSSAAQSGYVLLKGQAKTGLITGVKEASYDGTAISFSDATTYRDTVDAAYVGAPIYNSIIVDTGQVTSAKVSPPYTIPSTLGVGEKVYILGDEASHTAPRDHAKKVTMLYLWSGSKDSSNVLFSCPLSQYVGFSTADYSFVS